MPLLKAYRNLDLRPASVDALGRLTSTEERYIIDGLKTSYGVDRVNLPAARLDLALARSKNLRCSDLVITVRAKELPAQDRTVDPDKIMGVVIGHIATVEDKQALIRFQALRHTVAMRPRIDAIMMQQPMVLMIDAFLDYSRYPISSMVAFLLRKVQASQFGMLTSIICWHSTKIDVNLGTQLIQFGYKPYGIGDFEAIPNKIITTGKCLAMWSNRTLDQREYH